MRSAEGPMSTPRRSAPRSIGKPMMWMTGLGGAASRLAPLFALLFAAGAGACLASCSAPPARLLVGAAILNGDCERMGALLDSLQLGGSLGHACPARSTDWKEG